MWHWFYFHLHLLAVKADYEIQSSSNALRVNSRFHGWSFFCLPSPHALNNALNTYIYIFIYIYINENTIGPNYLHLASVCKKLNIITLAFSEGYSFPGVFHATATDESRSLSSAGVPSLEWKRRSSNEGLSRAEAEKSIHEVPKIKTESNQQHNRRKTQWWHVSPCKRCISFYWKYTKMTRSKLQTAEWVYFTEKNSIACAFDPKSQSAP